MILRKYVHLSFFLSVYVYLGHMFTEISLVAHCYLFIAGLILIILYMGYVFWYDHKKDMTEGDFDVLFSKEGLSQEQIENIKHDDDVWYYKDMSTCIGYSSDPREACPKFQNVCMGGKTFGLLETQIKEVSNLIKSGLIQHPACPLIYEGSD